MADVSAYVRCVMNYAWGGGWIRDGEIRPSSDAAVVANPQWWVAMTDASVIDSAVDYGN